VANSAQREGAHGCDGSDSEAGGVTPRLLIEPARLAGRSLLRMQTDERLVDLVRAGNDRAFEAIVDRYHRPLLRYCSRMLPPTRAEDVVQQAFLNAFAALRRGDAEIDLRPWLYRIAHNAGLNALRENGWSDEDLESFTASGDGPHEIAERLDSLRTVLDAVQTLPARQRDAMILRVLEGRTYEQIATELNATDGAVRQLLNRARNTLRGGITAVTPVSVLGRLAWTGQPVVERISSAVMDDGLRVGAARVAGALVAGLAIVGGISQGPRQLFSRAPASSPASAPASPVVSRPATRPRPAPVPFATRRATLGPGLARPASVELRPDVTVLAPERSESRPASHVLLPAPPAGVGIGTPAQATAPVAGPAPPQVDSPPSQPAALSDESAKAPDGSAPPEPVASAAQRAQESAPPQGQPDPSASPPPPG
jgi:RNA polymerase sigma factor (sigma-70 family)